MAYYIRSTLITVLCQAPKYTISGPRVLSLDLPRKGLWLRGLRHDYHQTEIKWDSSHSWWLSLSVRRRLGGGPFDLSNHQCVCKLIIYGKKEPVVHVLLAFRAPSLAEVDGPGIESIDMRNPSRHIYSRYTQQVSTRAEHILSRINVSDVKASFPKDTD